MPKPIPIRRNPTEEELLAAVHNGLPVDQQLRREAMMHMSMAWHILVRANDNAAAAGVERAGKKVFGAEIFAECMAEAVQMV